MCQIESSSSVVIIGGGAVGVELAGEIVHKHRDKKVTVLNSGKSLLSNVRLGEKLQDSAKSALEAKGVEVRLGERGFRILFWAKNRSFTIF